MTRTRIALFAVAVVVAVPPLAHASRWKPTPAAHCTVSGSTVAAVGLPTDQVVNFLVKDNSGTWGWVLGFTNDGTWVVSVPPPNGPTTYQFVSRTWGPNGSKYTVFASC
jgi:hypothetical protein